MRGKISADQLLFDPEIEVTARKNNSKTKKRKQVAKQRKEQESSSSVISSENHQQATMAEGGGGENNDTNAGFVNFTTRNMIRIGRPAGNERPPEVKTGLVQLMYANPFAILDNNVLCMNAWLSWLEMR